MHQKSDEILLGGVELVGLIVPGKKPEKKIKTEKNAFQWWVEICNIISEPNLAAF